MPARNAHNKYMREFGSSALTVDKFPTARHRQTLTCLLPREALRIFAYPGVVATTTQLGDGDFSHLY